MHTGDRLVASSVQNEQWSVVQNITQKLTYPRVGIGSIITYIEIIIDQVKQSKIKDFVFLK